MTTATLQKHYNYGEIATFYTPSHDGKLLDPFRKASDQFYPVERIAIQFVAPVLKKNGSTLHLRRAGLRGLAHN